MEKCKWTEILCETRYGKGSELTDFERWNKLRERNQQEEQIEEELKLIEEHNWDESYHIILLVLDLIGREASRESFSIHFKGTLL